MKRTLKKSAVLFAVFASIAWVLSANALASDAETSARATSGVGRLGTATGTARYEGDVGFARTDTRTGSVNAARSVAIGVDEDGVSLSVSLAVAPQRGPGFATTFNMSFDNDGGGSLSTGHVIATGGTARTVFASGRTTTGGSTPTATAMAGGSTVGNGRVYAHTESKPVVRRDVKVRRVVLAR